VPAPGQSDADLAREHTRVFRAAIAGAGVARANPQMTGVDGLLAVQPQAPGLADRIWWGSGTRSTARWAGEQGMHLMSSTLLTEDTGVPFDELQAEQIAVFRQAWRDAGHAGEPRVSVSRSVMPITTDLDRAYFGADVDSADQVGFLDGGLARFGRTYAGEPDALAEQLAADAAVREADTLLLTVPNMLGVEYNARLLATVAEHVAPALGWRPAHERAAEAAAR
jgi:alkanesulfonate monooxygenase SsuD/methylene tetrahydromethanopterin reductase-like flavin-dependent oxidoreductase (luciferase family)